VKTIMSDKGLALMGTGRAAGEKRAVTAMQQAIASPLLEDVTIDGATGLLINITGGRDLTLQEVNEALTLVHDAADEEAEIIFGSLIDDEVHEEVKITIIATGFLAKDARRPMAAPASTGARATPQELPVMTPVRVRAEPRAAAARPARDPSLPADEDQFDIPTFLRRQGQTDPA
jgi:cell division protein FtsZ